MHRPMVSSVSVLIEHQLSATIPRHELRQGRDAREVFVDRNALLERVADPDVSRSEIDGRNSEGRQEGTFGPERSAGDPPPVWTMPAHHLLKQPYAVLVRIDLEGLPADLMIPSGRIGETYPDLGMVHGAAGHLLQLIAGCGQVLPGSQLSDQAETACPWHGDEPA